VPAPHKGVVRFFLADGRRRAVTGKHDRVVRHREELVVDGRRQLLETAEGHPMADKNPGQRPEDLGNGCFEQSVYRCVHIWEYIPKYAYRQDPGGIDFLYVARSRL